MNKFEGLLKSRKFWASVLGVGLVVLRAFVPDFPISDEQISEVVLLLVAFIVGTGLEAGLSRRA